MLSSLQVQQLVNAVIDREGGYVNHPADPGGETKYGISKRSYPDLNIKLLTRADAGAIYERDFIKKHRLHELVDYATAEWVLDWLVHSGPSVVGRLQRKLGVTADGIIGDDTLKALNGMKDPKDILRWRLAFLVSLAKHPFLQGWINRLIKLGL